MKKFTTILTFILVVICIGAYAQKPITQTPASTVKRTNILDAFDQGKVQLTFEGIENGKSLQITAKNLTSKPLLLFINKGNTSFSDEIAITSTEIKNIDVPSNGKTIFKVPQKTGGQVIKSGSMTLSKAAPK